MNDPHPDARTGFVAAASAYTLWGVLPLYLKVVAFAGPWEILAQRILWSVPAAGLGVLLMGGFAETRRALAQPGVLRALGLSAVFITGNWGLYVWAVAHDHVIEASLAYFLVPLVSVAFGVLLFGEPITRLQFGALALAGVGIAAQAAAIGAFPWVALALCLSWSLYSLVRKQAPVPAAGGLLAETMILAPAAAVGLWWLARQPEGVAFGAGATPSLLLGLLGVVTAAPLILFAFGARRLRFSTLGMLQFIAPSLQFLIGVAWGEPLTPLRLFSFAVIWAGLAIYTWDAIARERRLAAAAPSRASTASPGSAE